MNTQICSHRFNPLHLFEAFADQLVYVSSILFFPNWYRSFPKRLSASRIELHCKGQFEKWIHKKPLSDTYNVYLQIISQNSKNVKLNKILNLGRGKAKKTL